MREIDSQKITDAVEQLCIKACTILPDDIYCALRDAKENEHNATAKQVLDYILQNADTARQKDMPICQDTGMAIVYVRLGQDVHVSGGNLNEAINKGVANGYTKGRLRASIVYDPIERVNTKDNTPAVIHYEIVDGETLEITLAPKGAGSENKSRLKMLVPADGIEGIKEFVLESVELADANSCPPMVVGVGIGGNMEQCALAAKKALLVPIGSENPDPKLAALEKELFDRINATGIGPSGMGGRTTAIKVSIMALPTHIAQLPVCVNVSCHATRHASITL